MRKITLSAANSLDNFIARTDHSYDWLMWSNEGSAILSAFWKTIDTILWGRKTYEVAIRQSGPKPHLSMKNYVFSTTLKPEAHPDVTIVSRDATAFVQRLKNEPGKGIFLMGGGELARPMFEAGLIDELAFNIHPILLGSGIPLFHLMSRQINLELLETQTFKNGCVYVLYRVKRDGEIKHASGKQRRRHQARLRQAAAAANRKAKCRARILAGRASLLQSFPERSATQGLRVCTYKLWAEK